MFWKSEECQACKAKDDIISFLKKQIEEEKNQRLDERAEYKRTVDRLLQRERIAPVGQGVQKPVAQSFSMKSLWDEIEKKDNEKVEESF